VAASLQTPALAGRSVRANIRLALRWWKCPRGEWAERTDSALRAIKADQLADRHATTLSGGEARRVHLARALALRSDVLLLDEPFAGLDPSTRADLLYDAESALRSDDRATLIVVHDRAEAWALADRVAIMLDGRIVQHGSPAEVFEHPATAAAAAFVGFTGTLQTEDGTRMYRPADVHIVEDGGGMPGTVRRAVPVEEGVRLELDMAAGTLVVIAPHPAPPVGAQVAVDVGEGILVADRGE
jgi:ABC-type sulfate/molybdate transport systems ATPase subunit